MFCSIKHPVRLDCVVLRADYQGSFPLPPTTPMPIAACDPFDNHFPNFPKPVGRGGGHLTGNLDSGVLMGRCLSDGNLFA